MAQLAISRDYFPAYARLPRKAQRKADEFLRKFKEDSTAAAIHLEPIKRTLDAQLRSARIGDDYRLILRAPEHGDLFLVLWADHHDEAYRWASTKQTAVHPATGSLQIFDVTEAAEALTAEADDEPDARTPERKKGSAEPAGMFEGHPDDALYMGGVPRALLPSVRAVLTDADLDRLLPHLPPEAGEILTALAAGISLDEALDEVLSRAPAPAAAPPPPPIDVTDVPAALARTTTQRQFLLLDGQLDLDGALKYPLDVWRVFLHPRQRQLARSRTKGPVRVLGGAGTGKTVVALHRVAFLVHEVFTKPDDRVLLTTYTVNLAHDLKAQLAKLLEPDQLARVEIANIDSWASNYLRSRGVSVRTAFEKDQAPHFDSALEVYGVDDVSPEFYRAEWREVIQDQGLRTEDEYVRAIRANRGVPLDRATRRRLWPVFAAYRTELENAGMLEPADILRRAREEREAATREGAPPRYRSVVVDETQDFTAEGLRLLRAVAGPEGPDDMFLVGDAHQRIYGRPVALSKAGIQVRGRRSQTLRLNYRTTGSICRWSQAILKDVAVDDLDDGTADRRGYVSLREGPSPKVEGYQTTLDEERAVVETVTSYIDRGTPAEAICIAARRQGPLRDRFAPALQRAGIESVILEQEEPRLPGVRLSTMHRVKGLEFPVMLLVGVSKDEIPCQTSDLRSDDAVVSGQALLRERSLFYVAATRARDVLHLSFSGEPSPFLTPSAPAMASTSARTRSTPQPLQLTVQPQQLSLARPARSTRPPPASTQAGAAEAASSTEQVGAALQQPLSLLGLGARLTHWAERRNVTTLAELAQRSPSLLLTERNLGRTSIQEARTIIERATGRRWEDLLEREPEPIAPAASLESGLLNWDQARAVLSDEQRATPLAGIELPARMRSFAEREGLVSLGDLAKHSRDELAAAGNLGRKSIADLPGAIADYLKGLASAESLAAEGLLECFKSVVTELEPTHRLIVTRRSGLSGEPMTLQELGEMFGVSRERIRQLEEKICEQMARQPWAEAVRRRIEPVLARGVLPLAELATDPWWAAAIAHPYVVGFMVDDVLQTGAQLVEMDEQFWLSRHKRGALDAAWSDLRAAANRVQLPAPFAAFEALASHVSEEYGAHLAKYFLSELRGVLKVEGEQVLAVGDDNGAAILAALRGSPEPIRIEDLSRSFGRRLNKFPDEVLLFGHGKIGLRRHFPHFDDWQALLVPECIRLIKELGPDRQWYCGELLDELREVHSLPDWFTAYSLCELIKAEGSLRYLGRLRVAMPGAPDGENRVFVHHAIEEILIEAGAPVRREELLEKLNSRLGTSEYTLSMAFNRPQFVRTDPDRLGLLERDVPGGTTAAGEAADHMEALLARRDRGLSGHHVAEEVASLSKDHATWTEELAVSVLRSDGRFRFSQSGGVGLAAWESTRVPTRLELVRGALDEAGGRVTVDAVLARIEAHYGDAPSRASLLAFAMHAEASVDGDWITSRRLLGTTVAAGPAGG